MKFEERSYSGKNFRPKPVVVFDSKMASLIVATSWGEKSDAERVAQIFSDALNVSDQSEVTSPYGYIGTISTRANQMRTAAIMANDFLYREVNRSEYSSCVEVLSLVLEKNVLSWLYVGAPHVILYHQQKCHPLVYNYDLPAQFNCSIPLPTQCLGVEPTVQLNASSVMLKGNSDIVLLSRSTIPGSLFSQKNPTIHSLSTDLVKDNENSPFWLGQLSI